jgi:2-succinyl-5-enolpyruvyl-6-hydroxy-3-cyclohexene-1-carboxylate synthase
MLGDIISNIHLLKNPITKHDLILMDQEGQQDLAPDLLITIGQSVLSKGLKGFLRKFGPKEHWHVGEEEDVADTFSCLTKKVLISPGILFRELSEIKSDGLKSQRTFLEKWQSAQKKVADVFTGFLADQKDGEFKAVHFVMDQLPDNCSLHLANSMAVRYASYVGLKEKANVKLWSNRGASGIDGCTSTAVGHAINADGLQVLITGDMAFFYDRNALWHEHVSDNLKIIILNNHGGGIFRLIDGPKELPELENYFETRQHLTAANTAKDFGFSYFPATSNEELSGYLDEFYAPSTGKSLLEIFSDPGINQKVFEDFRQRFQR